MNIPKLWGWKTMDVRPISEEAVVLVKDGKLFTAESKGIPGCISFVFGEMLKEGVPGVDRWMLLSRMTALLQMYSLDELLQEGIER